MYDIFGMASISWTDSCMKVWLILRAIFEIALAVNEFYLFRKVKNTMSHQLHFYYSKYHKKLYVLMIINVMYFLLWATHNIFDAFLNISQKSTRDEEEWIQVVYLIYRVVIFLFLITYVIVNSLNIKFKVWMIDVWEGLKILRYYHKWSIFIKI